ncbi:helix-turn-helix transcriptional regulator [Actinokineospora auranticolor]|uniref:Helix-turn-helix protein n=1 Tax=Actinokineospora auranticolor TaxID=155976 RepID=A0A2S6GMS6_9PSEU|nr:helix-turn-helix transcriptional regulator [Actinokineospora auranticolor]PPK66542.1 helix-turn-helix protein [Actinokineospora auranticolor]
MPQKKQPPTVRLRRLAAELRRLRAQADLSWEAVHERTAINKTTLYRIEKAQARPQKRTLLTLLSLYEAPKDEHDYLVDLLKDASKQGWLQPYHSDLPEEYTAYISFENEAACVRNYEASFIPGLLQGEDYARAVITGVLPGATDEEIENHVRARMGRQAVLTKDKPLKFWAVIDEAALHRDVGGPEVMRAQLLSLVKAAKAPNITLQIIPFGAGAHPGMSGQFVRLEFADAMDTDLIYIESMAGELFLESEADISRYRSIFDHLVAMALSPKESVSLLIEEAQG